ncbi:MAG: MobA-like protein [Myxococcales bacterium]|nr:MobA-like protein [Myxococcales bacterium]
MSVAAIVLATGPSNEQGPPKQLVPLRGNTLLRETVLAARASACDEVCVVLGANALLIAPALADVDVVFEHNLGWREGIVSSIRCGMRWARRAGHGSIVICVCDQPALTANHLDALIEKHRAVGRSVVTRHAGVLGLPAVFEPNELATLLAVDNRDSPALGIDWARGKAPEVLVS